MNRRTSLGNLGLSTLGHEVASFVPWRWLYDPDFFPGGRLLRHEIVFKVTFGGTVVEDVRSVRWGTVSSR